ncbi:MAG: UDP-N-acetylmuramoyl-tripeptide--D-alanyl-D-alanine ligase [Bacteroidetes bacterium]|nr:UDP-N-acetylmuramoyl-tripeptide--D-alanyl-D-alanine ligase [Bacteroidota bacterium]
MTLRIADLLRIPHVRAVNLATDSAIGAVVTDSRAIGRGDVFVAFRGSRVDAHDFVAEVCARGVLCCVVEQRWYRRNAAAVHALPLLVVKDSMRTYGAIAQLHRAQFTVPVLAITGSNGKTSTKEMVAAVLRTKFRVLATEGNFNNHIGLPSTLLRLTPEHQVVVTEMGTNQPGDIAYLCEIARPTHGMITNIGRAHIEKLQSREGIAAEKNILFSSLPADGVALLNADEPLLRSALPRRLRRIRYGTRKDCEIRIADVTLDRAGRAQVRIEAPAFVARPISLRLQAVGRHAAYNAAAALAAGFAFGCGVQKMKAALESVESYDKRLQIHTVRDIAVINDTYNANPDSVLAAIDLLQQLTIDGARCVVLGDMLELGKAARSEHEALGTALAVTGIPYVFTYGRHARAISRAVQGVAKVAMHFTDKAALCETLDALLAPGDAVLIKGSRGMQMEDIAAHLLRSDTSEEANG